MNGSNDTELPFAPQRSGLLEYTSIPLGFRARGESKRKLFWKTL